MIVPGKQGSDVKHDNSGQEGSQEQSGRGRCVLLLVVINSITGFRMMRIKYVIIRENKSLEFSSDKDSIL